MLEALEGISLISSSELLTFSSYSPGPVDISSTISSIIYDTSVLAQVLLSSFISSLFPSNFSFIQEIFIKHDIPGTMLSD